MPSEQVYPYSLPELYTPDEVIVLQYIYCDESGKAPKDPFISHCGYVIDGNDIPEFSHQWNSFCKKQGNVPPIHMRDILRPSEANGWAEVKRRWGQDWDQNCKDLLFGLADIVQRSPVQPLGIVLATGNQPSAEYGAFHRLVDAALRYVESSGDDGRIGVVVDDDYQHSIYYHSLVCKLRADTRNPLGRKIKSLCFADDKGYPLLQAADMLAYFARSEKTGQETAWRGLYGPLTKTPICEDKIEFCDAKASVALMGEFDQFNEAMDTILRADPKVVKAAMQREKQENAEKRKARKKSSASDREADEKD